nr:reverse transcriptase domain-containing protein [Tanacetum cinerariifolium]
MIKSSNRDTSFSLTYGTEAVIPAEIGMPTLRTSKVDLVGNNEALEIKLDLLEERREEAAIREAKSKAKMEKYYNLKVRNTSFKPGDLVYHNNDASRVEDTGKLGPKVLTDVAAYSPSVEDDYLAALQRLQSVNFSLIAELISNKDASIDTIMNLLRLEDSIAEKLGLTKSQPHVDQLMVPIHHSRINVSLVLLLYHFHDM